MKSIVDFIGILVILIGLALLSNTANAATSTTVYDDFSGSNLDTSKWTVEPYPSPYYKSAVGGYVSEYFVNTSEHVFHTLQNTAADREVILTAKRAFSPGESIEYDVNYVSSTGNGWNGIYINHAQPGIIGPIDFIGRGGQAAFGKYHVKITFLNKSVDITTTKPDGATESYTLSGDTGSWWPGGSNILPPYTFSFSTRTGSIGTGHLDYDNFVIAANAVEQKCSDGTIYGRCSADKPKYCDNGILADNAPICGCPEGYYRSGNTCSVGACTPEGIQECGNCGTKKCNAGGIWGTCKSQGACKPGDTKSCSVQSKTGKQECTKSCTWSECIPKKAEVDVNMAGKATSDDTYTITLDIEPSLAVYVWGLFVSYEPDKVKYGSFSSDGAFSGSSVNTAKNGIIKIGGISTRGETESGKIIINLKKISGDGGKVKLTKAEFGGYDTSRNPVVYAYDINTDTLTLDKNVWVTSAVNAGKQVCASGCDYNESCLPFGTRVMVGSIAMYCDVYKTLNPQLQDNEKCQNNYECLSNSCSSGKCVNIQQELQKQGNILQRIIGWLGKLFNFTP